MRIINNILILIIKFYKLFISPYIPSSCRYMPTCSDYFIDALKHHGIFNGLLLGTKRILRCHPIKFLGGRSGYDPVPALKKGKK